MENKDIYKLKLHEIMIVESDSYLATTVMRVAGGWIYRSYDKGNSIMSCVFVPNNYEFQ